jgi:siderophore synthetase component
MSGVIVVNKESEKREYLRIKKRESRLRAKKLRHKMDHTAPDQMTLTLSTGAKAIIKHAANKEGISASAWIERLVMRQTRAVKSAHEAMPGLFGD